VDILSDFDLNNPVPITIKINKTKTIISIIPIPLSPK